MLPRLLKLDFHDVFSEGLAFDGITANAMISRGVLHTDNLKMHGVQATVLMDGSADIANETTNLHVVVIPEFNLGTSSLVYCPSTSTGRETIAPKRSSLSRVRPVRKTLAPWRANALATPPPIAPPAP